MDLRPGGVFLLAGAPDFFGNALFVEAELEVIVVRVHFPGQIGQALPEVARGREPDDIVFDAGIEFLATLGKPAKCRLSVGLAVGKYARQGADAPSGGGVVALWREGIQRVFAMRQLAVQLGRKVGPQVSAGFHGSGNLCFLFGLVVNAHEL